REFLKFAKPKIRDKDLLIFTQQFRSLAKAKMELLESLEILYEQTENESLKEVASQLYRLIREGESLSDALRRFPDLFSHLYVSIIKAGEVSGKLDEALGRIINHYQRQEELHSKVTAVMIYPAIMSFVGIGTIIIFVYLIIPKIGIIFEDSYASLPLFTKLLIKMSHATIEFWLVSGIALIALIIVFSSKSRRKKIFQKLKENLPLLRGMTEDEVTVSFTQSLASLVASKMPIVESIEVAMLIMDNTKIINQLKLVIEDITSGDPIAKSMQQRTSFPKFFIRMLAIGEGSGRLEEVLNEISEAYLQRLERKLRLFTALLEPVIILVIGVIVGTLIISIMMPILQMNQLL
ncbi:MAG: type II secretion system F family protein, partial [bacterium]